MENEQLKFQCPKCKSKFTESQAETLDFNEEPAVHYCEKCFVKWVKGNVPQLKSL